MADKGKGLLALMVGAPKPKGEAASSPSGEAPDEKVSAVREFFQAGKAGDYEEAALVFERLYELCGDYAEPEGDTEDDTEDDPEET